MIFLSKKKIVFIASIILISIVIYNVNTKIFSNQVRESSIQTVALPINNKVIIIDSGHRWRGWRSSKR